MIGTQDVPQVMGDLSCTVDTPSHSCYNALVPETRPTPATTRRRRQHREPISDQVPPANPSGDDLQEPDPIDSVLTLLDGARGGMVYCYQLGTGRDRSRSYVLRMTAESFAEDGLDQLRDEFGPGRYEVRIKGQDGTFVGGCKRIRIAGRIRSGEPLAIEPAGPGPGGSVDIPAAPPPAAPPAAPVLEATILSDLYRTQSEMVTRLLEQAQKPKGGAMTFEDFAAMFRFVRDFAGGDGGDGGGLADLARAVAGALATPHSSVGGAPAGVQAVTGAPTLAASPPTPAPAGATAPHANPADPDLAAAVAVVRPLIPHLESAYTAGYTAADLADWLAASATPDVLDVLTAPPSHTLAIEISRLSTGSLRTDVGAAWLAAAAERLAPLSGDLADDQDTETRETAEGDHANPLDHAEDGETGRAGPIDPDAGGEVDSGMSAE